ncbi:glycosyltransferase family 1 protein [Jatrophihabitans telluris]|uniref:Glycosyltransferase family 1 protein n=1 Tax=Jatrophihabitans telluris TaxID=2038343 RepID=A0ABY4QZN7_9ACTN|nr:glycosyltransferase family 1 protein [Jatrophihabitans telluris]UQX89030.1 glycosyltransferase family 1 protein [Jatrophihabitans telluris]
MTATRLPLIDPARIDHASAVPSSTPATGPIRVASVPAGHVYVRHLSPPSELDEQDVPEAVMRLADPPPKVARSVDSQWWPPAMLSPGWIDDHAGEFDVFHIQFGFDALSPSELESIVDALSRNGKPLVYTVHDLRNPHHRTPQAHDAQLDVLIPAAAALITLTPGAAARILRRWGRQAQVISHPHVVPLDGISPRLPKESGPFVVGVHAKSIRASMDPLAALQAIAPLTEELPELRLRVDVHRDVYETTGLRHEPALAAWLRVARPGVEVSVHDYFTDRDLFAYLAGLDLSVLPYRFGTHSGWLETCYDLGTTVLAPDCGFYAEQRPCLSYHGDETGLDAGSLREAVRWAYRHRPVWQADRSQRAGERAAIASFHDALYRSLL